LYSHSEQIRQRSNFARSIFCKQTKICNQWLVRGWVSAKPLYSRQYAVLVEPGETCFTYYAHCSSELCRWSCSFLTGRRPETTRIYDLHTSWRDAGGDFVSIGQMFAENGFATRGFGKLNHPVCGSLKTEPGECDPLAWTLPYFHAPSENRWTCTVTMATRVSECQGAIPSHYTVSAAEENQMALPDTQIADAAIDQITQFATQRNSGRPPPPFFLGVGFRTCALFDTCRLYLSMFVTLLRHSVECARALPLHRQTAPSFRRSRTTYCQVPHL
jgi:hypothetical protein